MAIMYIPVLAKEKYRAFLALPNNDFPDTYDKWLYLTSKMSAEHQGGGGICQTTEIDPDEFAKYLRATGDRADVQSLKNFAFDKGTGHK
jgi:hypothetical protein